MSTDWIEKFETWAGFPGECALEIGENAVGMVQRAIEASSALKGRGVRVFKHGSYRNNTTVRADSDVDVAVCCESLVDAEYPADSGLDDAAAGLLKTRYSTYQFRIDVGAALKAHFGSAWVSEGNKAFHVHSNWCDVDAKVVPCIEHRRYISHSYWLSGERYWLTGTTIYPRSGCRIINWPDQTYQNGLKKSRATQFQFKCVVQIMKNLRNAMADVGVVGAGRIPSYLIESLVWNVPNEGFLNTIYSEDIRYILTFLFSSTGEDSRCKEWVEINDLEDLFRAGQPWTREEAHDFLRAAMKSLGMD